MLLPKIYPITDSGISSLTHANQTRALIKGGAGFIQIREKLGLSIDFYTSAKEAINIAHRANTKIIINDRVDIALATGADGVHLGQHDLLPEKARNLLGDDSIIGFSTHNEEQAIKAMSLPIDYIAIGPIFETKTKKKTDPVVGIDGVNRVREVIGSFPLVAIGGINSNNFHQVLDAGADSVAIISDILDDPLRISENLQKYLLPENW